MSDGTTSYNYDALNRVKGYTTGGQTRTNSYNGYGTLVAQVLGTTTTRYTQDLASPLSQVLSNGGASDAPLFPKITIAPTRGVNSVFLVHNSRYVIWLFKSRIVAVPQRNDTCA